MSRVLLLANHSMSIHNFRLELVERLLKDGHKVIISTPYGKEIDKLTEIGCEYHSIEISRHGMNPFKDLKLLNSYKRLIKEVKPDIVFTYTIKPNIYGSLACKKYKVPCVVNITGLGTAMENGGILQKITVMLYKMALKKVKKVFFQNKENMQFFIDKKIAIDKHDLLPGSGVNLEKFLPLEYPTERDPLRLVFIGRIMKEKGVYELAQVSRELPNIKFTIVGDIYEGSENPFSKTENVECVGRQQDVIPFIKDAHAVILPSYHEGMANVLLEGSACARPVLASNVHGCYETFDEGVTGFGFKVKDTLSLKEAILKLADLTIEERKEMGKKAREKMEKEFDRSIVVEKYCEVINKL